MPNRVPKRPKDPKEKSPDRQTLISEQDAILSSPSSIKEYGKKKLPDEKDDQDGWAERIW